MRRPLCYFLTSVACSALFTIYVKYNTLLVVNSQNDQSTSASLLDDVGDVLAQLTLWTGLYFVEKVLVCYIVVHYHHRRYDVSIRRSKSVHSAMILLYDTSLYLYPEYSKPFVEEDTIIRNAKGDKHSSLRRRVSTYAARLGFDSYKMASAFGYAMSNSYKSRWIRPASSYSVIDRAWMNPTAASALAARIWMSLVPIGMCVLHETDIVEVLGESRKDEAASIFRIIDENDEGSVSLADFVGMVTETGRMRYNVYSGMADMDHCLNTFDWLCLFIIAVIMTIFIGMLRPILLKPLWRRFLTLISAIRFVPALKEVQTMLASLAVGISFAIGRTFNHLLTGIIFVFFDHPFDIGDVVNVRMSGQKLGIACTVMRQSLLYTVFQRFDDKAEFQISNDQLATNCVENYSRSGINRQTVSILVDFRTSFEDLNKLRTTLEDFLTDNPRDYVPGSLSLSVMSLHELNKMELALGFTHRNNWSDNKLRSQRSNKFYCALIASCRLIPLYHPGGLLPSPGQNGNPSYTVQLNTATEAAENVMKEKERRQGLRWNNAAKMATGKKDEQCDVSVEGAVKLGVAKQEITKSTDEILTEEEALQKLTGLPNNPKDRGTSTAVDVSGAQMGLRSTARARVRR
ncbi:hypothetical protein PWT90_08038 [Aphanocladium album]|nr:hypothetical protein PWT90_08038 [Aphanocladium album]